MSNNNFVESITIKNVEVQIFYDEWAESPLDAFDSGIYLCSAHRRYNIGDSLSGNQKNILEAFKILLADKNLTLSDVIWQPVYLYDHSGLAFSTAPFSCGWDSGHLGFIYIVKDEFKKNHQIQRITKKYSKIIEDNFSSFLKMYQAYSNGEVYKFKIPGDENHDTEYSGFYGFDHEKSGLLEEATYCVEDYLERKKAFLETPETYIQISDYQILEDKKGFFIGRICTISNGITEIYDRISQYLKTKNEALEALGNIN